MPHRDYDLTSLRLFVEVCDLGNIAAVAEREHLVSSAVSKRMAQLEQHCASKLLERKRYGVTPTAAGQTLLAYARELLATVRRMDEAISDYASGVTGQVRLLANASVMAEALADDVVYFMQTPGHSNIRIDIEERLSPAVVNGVREGVAPIGIVWDRSNMQGLNTRSYRSDHLGVVVHKSHKLARRKRVAFAETLEWDYVGLPESSSIQQLLEQTALANGKRLRSKVMVASYEASMRVARAQLALCVVPKELLGHGFASGDLVHIPLTDEWAERRFVLCYRDEAQLSQAALALLDHLSGISSTRHRAAQIPN